MSSRKSLAIVASLFVVLSACSPKKKTGETQTAVRVVNVPRFNADSAYFFVDRQVKFGPRVPNTKAHQQAAEYFVDQLKKYGATVSIQDFDAVTWDNQKIQLKNIIASYNPQ